MRRAARIGLALAGAWLLPGAVPALEVLGLETGTEDDLYSLDAEVRIDAPVAAVRAVITDYAHLTRLSDRIEVSRIVGREPGATLVFTRVEGCFAFYCRSIDRVERVVESGPDRIEATVLPERSDVVSGKVVWQLHGENDGRTRVEYYTALEPRFWVPPFVGRVAIRRNLEEKTLDMFRHIEALAAEDGAEH